MDEPIAPTTPRRFAVAGVGASAGGLESLERLFRALPTRPGIAFVVVQHLSPEFKSLMDELMGRFSSLSIHRAADGDEVLPDHVYMLPPGKEIELVDGRLRLFDRDPRAGLTMPIDRFLSSLAKDASDRAIAVILSGSGTDGSRGARRVREAGGLVLVEDPEQARFDGMPRASLDVADQVLPAEALAVALVDRAGEAVEATIEGFELEALNRILALLRGALSIDFAQYKLPTVLRRIRRRMALVQLDELGAFVDLLAADPAELSALGHDLLIGVTRFYRDPATWDLVDTEALRALAAEARPSRGLRAWVAGCATGEEAYSVAMSLLDAARPHEGLGVKVFATDVHRRALDVAGQGLYPAAALEAVSPERRARYFVERPGEMFQVGPELRQAVVFAHHNVLKDAPFTQLDFVSCRNLLIYFRPSAQRQALALLGYGLRLGGVLLLGPSESLGETAGDFEVLDETHRLFVKRHPARRVPELSMNRALVSAPRAPRPPSEAPLLGLYDAVLDRVMPPSFLIDAGRSVLDSFGGAERHLQVRARRPSSDLVELVPETARLALAGGVARASREGGTVRFDGVAWGPHERFDLVIHAIDGPHRPRAFLVVLERNGPPAAPAAAERSMDVAAISAERFIALELELDQCKASLQATVEELESSGEEMQATNEELVASNEELQSTNEELHSVNEELHTVNAELQAKIRELSDLNRDMRLLFESIDAAIVFLDAELRIRRFTPRAAAMFGLLEHDVGRPLASFQHPLRRASLMSDLAACRDEGTHVEYEVADAQGRTHLVRARSYLSPEGSGVVLTVTDVTVLAAARKRVDLLSSIVESSADAIIAFDDRRVITSWNAAAARLYGYPEAEAVGMSFDRLVPTGLRPELVATLARVWAGEVAGIETQRLTRDGACLDVSTTISPVRDGAGRVVGASKIDRDIGERKRREAALAEREQRLSDLYDNSPDMLASVDLRSDRVVEHNATLARQLGYGRDELARMRFTELYVPADHERVRAFVETLRRDGELRDVEASMRRRDGTELEVSLSATGVRGAGGEVERGHAVIRDNSARKRAERELAQTARLRERFMAMVSHELRTPLYAASSATALLCNASLGEAPRRRALEVLQRQTAQMTRLLDDLLDVSRITEDRLRIVTAPIDLRDPIRAAVEACAPAFAARGVRLASEDTPAPLPMMGDPARLQQVVTNLLTNALRHSPVDSCVTVEAARRGDVAVVRVTDEGDGIDPERLPAIFELFSRVEADQHSTRGGLGIGLALARGIVEGHGGSLRVASEGLGRGATFSAELPLREAPRVAAPPRPAGAPVRLVVVEDQPDSLEMVTMLLETSGHVVVPTATGRDGVATILRERPDVALVDIGLPDIDGYAVARAVRAALHDSVGLIALTGYGQPEDIARSREAGFDRHVTKPLEPERLEQEIQRALRPRAAAAER